MSLLKHRTRGYKAARLLMILIYSLTASQLTSLLTAIFSFFDFNIKFGKTMHEAITLVATTLKALLAVTKANGRFSRRKLNIGNVYDLFSNLLAHISLHQHIKRCATEVTHRKTQTPSCRQTNLYADRYCTIKRESHFYLMDSFNGMHKKGIIIPQRKIYLSTRLLSSFGTIIISQISGFVNIFS